MKWFSFRHRRYRHEESFQFTRDAITQGAGRTLSVELLEPRVLLDADVVISELEARNSLELIDYYDDDSDWIEIHNRGPSRVDLKGWHLSDDLENLTQWQFPVSALLAPGERLVVFASGEDSVTVNDELHTNFRIDAEGEPLVLSDQEGALVHGFSSAFPPQAQNVSYVLM